MKLDAFTRGYLIAALWTSDPNPSPGEWAEHDDWRIDRLSMNSIIQAISDCTAFQVANESDLAMTSASDERNGHDFWLTRNGHGAGFWDRGYGRIGERLTAASHAFGELSVEEYGDAIHIQ